MEKLPLDQRTALLQWLAYENLTYIQASARLASEYQVKASASVIARFYSRNLDRRVAETAVQVHLKDYAPALHARLIPLRRARRKRRTPAE